MSPIVRSQHTKMSLQRRLEIYIGCESPYVESSTIDLFKLILSFVMLN